MDSTPTDFALHTPRLQDESTGSRTVVVALVAVFCTLES
jgi:hypothetical protein